MSLLIGFLTFILVMNCLLLMLLVLIQLPKKEAGAGIAFGGAATDALFGAGSGNALTKVTKYAATFFIALSILLSVLQMNVAKQGSRALERELSRQASTPVVPTPIPAVPSNLNFQATPAPAQPAPAATSSTVTTFSSTNQAAPAPAPAETPAPVLPTPEASVPAAGTPQPAAPAK